MKFIETIKSLFSADSAAPRRGTRTYVVDGARLVDEKTGRRMAPREQIQLLHSLSKVAKQEGLNIVALFESDRPLREVESGGEFEGVTVYFEPDTEQLVARALKVCRKGSDVLVSSGVTLESRATELGHTVLCSGTFRKAFLANMGGERRDRGDRGDRGDRRHGGHDRRRDRGPRRGNGNSEGEPRPSHGPQESAAAPAEAPAEGGNADGAEETSENRAVRNLIDLVE